MYQSSEYVTGQHALMFMVQIFSFVDAFFLFHFLGTIRTYEHFITFP